MTATPPATTELTEKPTRGRYVVLGFLSSMAFVLYLDRVCISQALVPMQAEFGLTNTQTSLVLMSFTLAYGLFEVPTGRWGDLYGSRRVLTRIVLWWSAFTAITGCVWSFRYEFDILSISLVLDSLVLLIVVRFLFGAGEAGALPCTARIMTRWFASTERGRALGVFQAAMHIGGTVAPMMAAMIIEHVGWRWAFIFFGLFGVIWAGLFYWWFRDQPADHPGVNSAEVKLIGPPEYANVQGHDAIPWCEAAGQPNIWLLCIIVSMTAFNSYLFFSWYSTYLQQARAVSNIDAGRLASLVLGGATVGALLGGVIADRITRHAGNRYRARRLLGLAYFAGAASCLFASVHVDSPGVSAGFCALACLLMFLQQPTWWACAFDVCGKHIGALFGLLNGVGGIGAISSQYFFGAFSDWRKSQGYEGRDQWDPAFYVCAALLLTAGILWQFVYPCRPIGHVDLSPSPE